MESLNDGKWLTDKIISDLYTIGVLESLRIWFVPTFVHNDQREYSRLVRFVPKDIIEICEIALVLLFAKGHWGLIELRKEDACVYMHNSLPEQNAFSGAKQLFPSFAGFLKKFLHFNNWPKETNMKTEYRSPTQENSEDCGVFDCASDFYVYMSLAPNYPPSEAKRIRQDILQSIVCNQARIRMPVPLLN